MPKQTTKNKTFDKRKHSEDTNKIQSTKDTGPKNKIKNNLPIAQTQDKKRKRSEDQKIRKKNKSSRFVLFLKDCQKWSDEESMLILCHSASEGGIGLDRNQSDTCKPFSGGTIHDIITCYALNYSEDSIIEDLRRDRPKATVTCLTKIIRWVARFKSLLGYANWSSKGIGGLLQKEKAAGGADIPFESFKALSDIGFNGKTLDQVVGYLGKDYSLSKIVQFMEDESQVTFTENMKQTIKDICEWVEKTLLFVINVPLYEPLVYSYKLADKNDLKYLTDSKGFTISELRLLSEIQNFELKDLSKVTSGTDKFTFEIQNRQEAFGVIEAVAYSQFNASQKDTPNKQDFTFLIAVGGSGSGKSRIVTEMNDHLRSLNNAFRNSSVIYFNFRNGFDLDSSERDKELISMICSRIIYSSFLVTASFLASFPKLSNDLFLYELFRIISNKLHARYNLDENVQIPLILALDEYQEATRTFENLNRKLQHKIGWYMRSIQKRHGLIIIPVFSGTLTRKDANFEPTHYKAKRIPLPALRPKDIKSILVSEKLEKFYNSKTKHFWNLVGVIPRHLEWGVAEATLQKRVNIPQCTVLSTIYTNIVGNMYTFYEDQQFSGLVKQLALLTLSGYSIDNVDQKYQKLCTKLAGEGLIYKTDDHIGVPPAIIEKISEKYDLIPRHLLTDNIITTAKPEWEVFEEMCLKTLTCKLNVLLTIKKTKSFQVSELFKGAHIAAPLQNMTIGTDVDKVYYRPTNKQFSKSLLGYDNVTKAKKCEKGIDGFLPIFSKKKVFLIQNKCVQRDTKDKTMYPNEIATYFQNANVKITNKQVYVVLFTNKIISLSTKQMIVNGQLQISNQKKSKITCDNLIVISGDCFRYFFHPYISEIMVMNEADE